MRKSITCWCKIFSGFQYQKWLKNLLIFDRGIKTLKEWPFLRHGVGDGRRFRVTASHVSKVANFNLPHLHLAPPFGVIPFEFYRDLQRQKTRVTGLWWGILCMILPLAISVGHRLVIDKQTGRHTTMAYAYIVLAWRWAVKTVRCATIVPWYQPAVHFTTTWALSPSWATPPPVGFGGGLCRLEGASYIWQGDHHVGHWPTF